MSIHKLKSGLFDNSPIAQAFDTPISDSVMLEKKALLVYEGEFQSMDGPVEVTKEILMRLATNHNAYVEHCCSLAGSTVEALPMKDYPPLQLDHSTSAKDTVGRLVGKIELGPYIRKDGKEVLGAYGYVRVMGRENVEKVNDGRWTHLSVGVNFENGSFSELTITPFPAAPEASMLSHSIGYKGATIAILEQDENGTTYSVKAPGISPQKFKEDISGAEAIRKAKKIIDGWESDDLLTKLSGETNMSKLAQLESWRQIKSKGFEYKGHTVRVYEVGNKDDPEFYAEIDRAQGTDMVTDINVAIQDAKKIIDKEVGNKKLTGGDNMDEEMKKKLKKHLTEEQKMSEEDAEKHLAKCSEDEEEMKKLSAEVEEKEAKLAAEEADKAKLAAEEEEKAKLAAEEEEKKAMKAKLTAARESISRMSTDFRATRDGAMLAAKKGTILVRLSALRSQAKITPAEVKKMDIDKLSASNQETIDAVLKTYENREPVIMTGQLGSIKAEELHKLTAQTRMSKLEHETRANMSLLKKTANTSETKMSKMEDVNVHIDTTPHNHYEMESEAKEIEKLMDEGKKDEAKMKMRECLKKALSYGSSHQDQLTSGETEKQLSALAESANKMQAQFEELHKLAGSLVGND